MADLDWFSQAQNTYPDTPTSETAGKPSKGFAEATGEVLGGIGGATLGILGEIGTFVENIPYSVKELATRPVGTFKDFAKEVELLRSDTPQGQAERELEPETGLARVLKGAVSQTGKQLLPTQRDETGKVVKEAQYQSTPFYEAAKRDALNLGEGLVDLASAAIGFNSDALQRAQAQMEKEGRPTTGFMAGLERGGRAGVKAGEEFAGGIPAGGIFLGQALYDAPIPFLKEGSPEGKRFYREAPITTMLSALPILKGLGRGIAAGTLSAAQKARVAGILARIPNPATGKPFASVVELTQHLEQIEKKVKGGEQLTPEEAGLRQVEGARTIPIEAEALTQAVEGFKKSVPAKVAKVATKVAERLPYVAAATSLGGPIAGAVAGALAYGGPLLDAFRGTGGPVGKVATAVGKGGAKAKRAVVERRTYETPMAEQVGEERLTAAGETRAVEAKVGDIPEAIANKQIAIQNVPEPVAIDTTAQPAEIAQRLIQERQRQQAFPVASQIATEDGGNVVIGEEGAFRTRDEAPTPSRRIAVNPEAGENATLFEGLKRSLEGTELDPYDPKTGFEVPNKILDIRRLFASMGAAKEIPSLMLLDPDVRARTITLIEEQTGTKFSKEGRANLDTALINIGNETYGEQGTLTQQGRTAQQGAVPTLTQKNYQIRTPQLSPEAVEQLVAEGKPVPDVSRVSLNDIVRLALEQSGKVPERVVFNNFLRRYNQTLMRSGGGMTPAGGLTGRAGGFTNNFTRAIRDLSTGDRDALGKLFDNSAGRSFELMSVEDKARTLARLNTELIEPQRTDPAYKGFIQDLKTQVEAFKETPATEGYATFESVAELPLERGFEVQPEAEPTMSKAVGLAKRLATTYNPSVIWGNYLGNSLVESLATGRPVPFILGQQIVRATRFVERVKEAKKTRSLSLRDELVVRAIPTDSISIIENFGTFNLEGKVMKPFTFAYEWGDRLPKTAEAVKQADSLVSRLERAEGSNTFALRTGPELFVYLTKNADGSYSVINPRSGNIIASGGLDNAKIKRVLGAAVKQSVETKFPDVRNLPKWFEAISRARGAGGLASLAVVFQPFMSYVLKAADSPYRAGILTELMTMGDDPIMFEYGGTGKKQAVGNLFNRMLDKTYNKYLLSRGMINSFMARYNSLNQEERDQLRNYFAFYPTEERSLILGELMKLKAGDQARRTNEPSFVNFFSMTDTYARLIPAIVNTITKITGGTNAETLKELGSENPEGDYILDRYASGKVPDERDILKAVGTSGGLAKELFIKLTDPSLGAKPATERDYARVFGILGKLFAADSPNTIVKEEIQRTGKPDGSSKLVDLTSQYVIDTLVGGSILDPKINDVKVRKLIEGSYAECWNNLIQPLLDKATLERKKGNEERAVELESIAENLNEKIKDRIESNVDARVDTLSKIGIQTDLRTKDYKKVFRDIEPKEVDVETQPEAEPEQPATPFFERSRENEPAVPAGKYNYGEQP